MLRRFVLLTLLLVPFAMTGCGDSNSDAPLDTQAHPANWIATHPGPALAEPGFSDCIVCHGSELNGSGAAVSCFSCHSFNDTPPFTIHPASWSDAYIDHRAFAATNGFSSCANCHGADLTGSVAAPSCFSSSFNGLDCHAEGPGTAPHPLDGTYLNGALHGPDAEADLVVCQGCHGESGGPGSNPRFNIGIDSAGGTGCEDCHGVNYAHPPTWGADPSATFHNNAGNIANACTLCHGVALDGVGGVGTSCFACHGASPADNPSGCVSCHGQPPNGLAPVGDVSPNRAGQHGRGGHTALISSTPSETCDRCHSGAGTGTAAHFDMAAPADLTLPFDPQDTITPVFDGSNFTCNGSCHVIGPFGVFDVPHVDAQWY